MDGHSQAVALGGLALVGVNAWTSSQRQSLGAVFSGQSNSAAAGHTAWLALGGELALVTVMTLAAEAGPSLGTGMVAAIAALWVLWAIHYYTTKGSSTTTKPQAATGRTPAPAA